MARFALFALLLVALAIAGATAQSCPFEKTTTVTAGGLYTTDGEAGVTVESFVTYALEGKHSDHIRLCEMGLRFPHPDRITHCVDATTCPPGAAVQIPFNVPGDLKNGRDVLFKLIGWEFNQNGHPQGNYEEYRHFWDNCANNEGGCANLPASWSYTISHVDVHFFFLDQAEVTSIAWDGFPTTPAPADINAKCNDEPARNLAAPADYYSANDCVPAMGRHWIQDKLETKTAFGEQPSLLFGTYGGESAFWEPMVAASTFDWVAENGVDGQATISWPQPEAYFSDGFYPTHYGMAEVRDETKQIGGGRTVSVSFKEFVYRSSAAAVLVPLALVAVVALIAA